MNRKLLFLARIVLVVAPCAVGPGALVAHAQGTRKDDIVLNARGVPAAGVNVAVCAQPANTSTTPCSPLALIYSNAQLTQALVNPLTTDGLGNYSFYAAPSKYTVQIYGATITTKVLTDVTLPSDPSAPTFTTLTTTSGIAAFTLTLSGNLTVGGAAAVTGNLSAGTMTLANQGSPPGTATAGTVNLYTKSADKKLYYKDETGAETGPLSGGGVSPGTDNTWTNNNRFKGPLPWRDVTGYMPAGGCSSTQGPTTGNITTGTATLSLTAALDFKNGCGIAVLGAGPLSTLATPTQYNANVANNGFTRAGSTVTVTTSAAHTLLYGMNVTIAGATGCATSPNGTFTILTVPTGTTFTFTQAGTAETCGGSAATATVSTPAVIGAAGATTHNYRVAAVDSLGGKSPAGPTFTLTTSPASLTKDNSVYFTWPIVTNAVGYVVYRDNVCVGTPYTNAYMDYGFTGPCVPGTPAAPSASAAAQILSTIINSGGGTTSLVLAANASTTATTQSVWHDNASFINSALTDAASDQSTGPTYSWPCVYVPQGMYDFTRITWPTTNTSKLMCLQGTLRATILPLFMTGSGGMSIRGWPGSGGSGFGPGTHFPTVPIVVPSSVGAGIVVQNDGGNNLIENIQLPSVYGHGIVLNGHGRALSAVTLRNVDISEHGTLGTGSPLLIYENTIALHVENFIFTGRQDATGLAAIYFSGQATQTSSIDIDFHTGQLNFHTVKYDQPIGGGKGGGGNLHHFYDTILSENSYDPGFVVYDGGYSLERGMNLTNVYIAHTDLSDTNNATRALVYQLGNSYGITNLESRYFTGVGLGGHFQRSIENNFGLNNCSGWRIFEANDNNLPWQANGSCFAGVMRMGGQGVSIGAPLSMSVPSTSDALITHNLGPLLGGSNISATPNGAGSLAAGTYYYVVTGLDEAGGETVRSQEVSATVGASSAILVSYAGTNQYFNYRVYRGTAAGAETVYYTTTSQTSFNDTGAASTAGSPPTSGTALVTRLSGGYNNGNSWIAAGAAGNPNNKVGIGTALPATKLDVNGVITARQGLVVNGDAQLSAAPRGIFSAFLSGALTATWTAVTWTPDKSITVTRVQVQAKTAPAGCAPNAVVRVSDGVSPQNVTVTAAANDSGSIAQNYAAGSALTIAVSTAAAGCTTSPADANVLVQYRMQ